jgi:hypothetical protein
LKRYLLKQGEGFYELNYTFATVGRLGGGLTKSSHRVCHVEETKRIY